MEIFVSLTEKTKLGKRTKTSGSKLSSGQNIFVLKPLQWNVRTRNGFCVTAKTHYCYVLSPGDLIFWFQIDRCNIWAFRLCKLIISYSFIAFQQALQLFLKSNIFLNVCRFLFYFFLALQFECSKKCRRVHFKNSFVQQG